MGSAWIMKIAHRIPELLARAAAGDPVAIALLAAMGISAIHSALKDS